MKRRLLIACIVAAFTASAAAQGRSGGGMGGGQMGQGQGRGAGAQGMGMGQGSMTRARALDAQQQRYRECTQATTRLRKRLRAMSRLQSGAALGADQALRYREQLHQEATLMLQERTDWLDTLTEPQKTAAQEEIANSEGTKNKLQDLVDLLDFELGEPAIDTEKVRQNAAQAEATVKQLEQEQQEIADIVGSIPNKGE